MKKNPKKLTAISLSAAMLMSLCGPLSAIPVYADAVKVVTLGADLSDVQKENIMQFFGVDESQVYTITITNKDEHDKLGLLIPAEQIGTHTFSCAMVSPTTRGGIQVKTANMNYVTSNMIASTLSTSGVVNCDVLTAAPFEVSGTGALTGTMMAYETASGETLDEAKKELANEELVTTEELADTVGQEEATLVVNDIKIHVIRDQIKEEEKVRDVVDEVVTNTETAMQNREAAGGIPVSGRISDTQKESLYSFGYKVSQQDYKYDDMKVTLQRVTENVSAIADLVDPITETFEDLTEESRLADDSILRETDDEALGEESNVNATDVSTVNHEVAEPVSTSTVTVTPVSVVENASASSQVSVLAGKKDGAAAILDMTGNPLTEYRYNPDTVDVSEKGNYLIVQDAASGLYGMLNTDGTEVIPCQYTLCSSGRLEFNLEDDTKYERANQYWQLGYMLSEASEADYDIYYRSAYYKIESADVYFIEDGTSQKVAELGRDDLLYWRGYEKFISIRGRNSDTYTMYDSSFQAVEEGITDENGYADVPGSDTSNCGYQIVNKNGQQMVADADGNEVLAPGYKYIQRIAPDGIVVSDGEKNGLVDYDGNVILPCIFNSIHKEYYGKHDAASGMEYYKQNGYFAVDNENGILCFAVEGGGITYDTGLTYQVSDLDFNVCSSSASYKDEKEVYHIVSADGVETELPAEFVRCDPADNAAGRLYKCQNSSLETSIVDWHGEVLWSGVDYAMVVDNYLTISANGEVHVYELSYSEAPQMEAIDDGLRNTASFEEIEGGTQVSDIGLTKVKEIENADFIYQSNNLMIEDEDTHKYALSDMLGNTLTDFEYEYGTWSGNEGLLRMQTEKGLVFTNQENEVLSKDEYDYIESLENQWVVGYKLESVDIGDQDPETVEADFQNFSGDKLNIVTADLYRVADDAKSVQVKSFTREEFQKADAISKKYVLIQNRTSGLWEVYDEEFNKVGDDYEERYDADVSVAFQSYSDNGREGLKDTEGNIVIQPAYRYIGSVNEEEGYATVNDGEHYGLVDFEGHLILPVEYDAIYKCTYDVYGYNQLGYFLVYKDGKAAFVKQGGELTCQTEYAKDNYDVTDSGVSLIEERSDGTTVLTAADGVVTELDSKKENVRAVRGSQGMLYTYEEENYKKSLIDWHGNLIMEKYNDFNISNDKKYLIAENQDSVLEIYEINFDGME